MCVVGVCVCWLVLSMVCLVGGLFAGSLKLFDCLLGCWFMRLSVSWFVGVCVFFCVVPVCLLVYVLLGLSICWRI